MACSCSSCHYYLSGPDAPRPEGWCGWHGGEPDPGGGRCNGVPPKGSRVPKGFVIAQSSRVVKKEDLEAENASYAECAGRSD